MTEKQNNKNKEYNKVIDAMKTIQNFCNNTLRCMVQHWEGKT